MKNIVMLQNDNNKDWIPLATEKQREFLSELGYYAPKRASRMYVGMWIEKVLKGKYRP